MAKDKKEKKEKKEKKPKGMTTDQKLDVLIGAVSKLVELNTVQNVEKSIDSSPEKEEKTGSGSNRYVPSIDDETYPNSYMPPKYRSIVDSVLSTDFGARVIDFDDRTEFQFDIIVPEKYSSVPKSERDLGVKDIRTRIIPRALGENGVREWCNLIRKNLSRFYAQEGVKSPFNNVEE